MLLLTISCRHSSQSIAEINVVTATAIEAWADFISFPDLHCQRYILKAASSTPNTGSYLNDRIRPLVFEFSPRRPGFALGLSQYAIYGGLSDTRTGFSPSSSVFC
jgi:hypothetical protein